MEICSAWFVQSTDMTIERRLSISIRTPEGKKFESALADSDFPEPGAPFMMMISTFPFVNLEVGLGGYMIIVYMGNYRIS